MNYRLLTVSLLCIAYCLFPIGCKDAIDNPDLSKIVFPATHVSYGRHVEPLFLEGCAYSGCHDSETRADGLSLETYQDAISSRPGVVIPNDTTCIFILRIKGQGGFPQEPFQRPPLNKNQIEGLTQWIREGAQNN